MAINFTNINKTNNHLSSSFTEHKQTTSHDVGNTAPGGINPIKCVPPENWISNGNTYIIKQ
jgi:hypothetical protein